MASFAQDVLIKLSNYFSKHDGYFKNHLERNMRKDELVDMLLLQGDSIEILIKEVKKLESKSDSLEKNLTARVEELEEEAKESKSEIDDIFRILNAT